LSRCESHLNSGKSETSVPGLGASGRKGTFAGGRELNPQEGSEDLGWTWDKLSGGGNLSGKEMVQLRVTYGSRKPLYFQTDLGASPPPRRWLFKALFFSLSFFLWFRDQEKNPFSHMLLKLNCSCEICNSS
jgi:hypothetical protein